MADASTASLSLVWPSGAARPAAALARARRRLAALGFELSDDDAMRGRGPWGDGSDALRLAALLRVAAARPSVALAGCGGHGLGRLLDAIAWKRLARSVEAGTRWVGHGDFTLLQLALLAHTGAASWAGPMAIEDFGRADADGGLDDVTRDCFVEAMDGSLEAVGFRTEPGFDGLERRGTLWGGNLTLLLSLLGTRHWPAAAARGGVLFLEDAAATPIDVERGLLQLRRSGVLPAQKAVLLGAFPACRPRRGGQGAALKASVARVAEGLKTPLIPGLPFGHVHPKLCLPVGRRVQLVVQGREVLILG